ncbi:MAG: bis-aminopropyl spermidine synthase family protein [Candidatus Bathyarchaeia archaeon]
MGRIESRIITALAYKGRSIWELLDISNCPLKDFINVLRKLIDDGLIAIDGGAFYLTEKGKRSVNPESLKIETRICPNCAGKRVIAEGRFKEILEDFKRISSNRPTPTLEYFQGYMLEEDVIARTALMHYYHDLDGKSIVMIGDDDLLSVALALTRLPSRIVVLDIDSRLGEFLEKVNGEYGFSIEFIRYNVADPLPESLRGQFDVFSSEPLETLSGLRAFISRGVACLKENGVGYFGLTHYEASHKKWLAVQKLLSRMNCVITDIIQGFSVYPMDYGCDANYEAFVKYIGFEVGRNPGVNWYKSALFRFEVLGKPKLILKPDKPMRIQSIDKGEDITHPALYKNMTK